MTTDTPRSAEGRLATLDEAGLIRFARDLAAEMRHDPEVRATLLALAAQNDRLLRRYAELEARHTDVLGIAAPMAGELSAARAWARRWKRAAKDRCTFHEAAGQAIARVVGERDALRARVAELEAGTPEQAYKRRKLLAVAYEAWKVSDAIHEFGAPVNGTDALDEALVLAFGNVHQWLGIGAEIRAAVARAREAGVLK